MLKALARRCLDFADRLLLPFAARFRRLAPAYYVLLPWFSREQRAVLAGRLHYAQGLEGAARGSSALLRRNVHRLEKGLVMRPRAPRFAEDYIGETVEEFLRCSAGRDGDADELRWARDVLTSYFAAVGESPAISRARSRWSGRPGAAKAAQSAPAAVSSREPEAWSPYERAAGARSDVAYEDFLALCRQRRSVRWFLPQTVPDELLRKALAAAAQAPSACNRQPFLFRYFGEPAEAARIAGIALGTAGYAHNVPALVVVLGDLGAYPFERDRHLIYIDAALAAMQFMLALETLGLASCPINWPDIEACERRMDAALGLPRHLRPVMLIALGYPDPTGGVPYSAKKSVATLLRRDNHYDGAAGGGGDADAAGG